MKTLGIGDPLARAAVRAVQQGHVDVLHQLLTAQPGLANARIGKHSRGGMSRTLLHVATDWPGHFPRAAASVAVLAQAGADVNARFRGPCGETPLHWAASSDDVAVLAALLDAGAEIDASGAVIAGGTPLDDATAFAQWKSARRLVARGARVNLFAAASLGLMDQLQTLVVALAPAASEQISMERLRTAQISDGFWAACHGGQVTAAQYLLHHGAVLDWLPAWEPLTPLDAAARSGATEVLTWLHSEGASTASRLRGD